MAEKRNGRPITLGSGDLMIKEYTDTLPAYTEFDPETDLLGHIKGGFTLEYSGEWYSTKDDAGKVEKTLITEEEILLKSGVLTWNGKTLAQLCATARVTENGNIRTVKIGGAGNNNGKSYALCFHHHDPVDGDVWLLARAVNRGGFSLAFVKDAETVIDAEFKCLPSDTEGTLVQYIEEIGEAA